MKTTSKKLVIHQPNKKYLLEKTVFEMKKDQNDNQESIKEEPFLVQTNVAAPQEQASGRRVVYCSDGIIELDENGNPVEIEKVREKRSVMSSVVRHKSWNVFDSVDSPFLNSAGNLGSTVGRKTISAIDYLGNMVASLIGITGEFIKCAPNCIRLHQIVTPKPACTLTLSLFRFRRC